MYRDGRTGGRAPAGGLLGETGGGVAAVFLDEGGRRFCFRDGLREVLGAGGDTSACRRDDERERDQKHRGRARPNRHRAGVDRGRAFSGKNARGEGSSSTR